MMFGAESGVIENENANNNRVSKNLEVNATQRVGRVVIAWSTVVVWQAMWINGSLFSCCDDVAGEFKKFLLLKNTP